MGHPSSRDPTAPRSASALRRDEPRTISGFFPGHPGWRGPRCPSIIVAVVVLGLLFVISAGHRLMPVRKDVAATDDPTLDGDDGPEPD